MAKPTKREWTVTDNGTVVCFKSETYDCVVADGLTAVAQLTAAHDKDLARATEKINKILAGVRADNKYNKQHLCFLITHKGPLLAWTQEGVRGADKEADIECALKLR
jgi:hypothetical protein